MTLHIARPGVALATVSATPCRGATQLVIAVANETSRKIRAVAAGFAKLQPMPPNRHLTTTIAINEPTMAIQSGSVTGTLNPRIMPVTTALQSWILLWVLVTIQKSCSKTTQEITQVATSTSAGKLK